MKVDSRDRVERKLKVDEHVQATLEFMQENIPSSKLIGVAEAIPQLARLLWNDPQEPFAAVNFHLDKSVTSDQENQLLATARG